MEKLMKKYNNSRRNGGFSLVELIIVIAIMAALVAVLAPQYIKYIEKSRISADQTAMDELYKAVQVALSDETSSWKAGDIALSVDATTGAVTATWTAVDGTGTTKLSDNVKKSLGDKMPTLKSKIGKALSTKAKIMISEDGTAKWSDDYTSAWTA